jgi:hypothetical protein
VASGLFGLPAPARRKRRAFKGGQVRWRCSSLKNKKESMENDAEQTAEEQIIDILNNLDSRLRAEVVEHIHTGEESFFEHLSDRPGDLAAKANALKAIMGVLGVLDSTTRNRLLASLSE